MICPIESRHPETLLDYVAGTLDARTVRTLEEHFAVCAECASSVADQSAIWAALDNWEAPAVSADFDRRLYHRIGQTAHGSWWQRSTQALRNLSLLQALPLMASVCLLLIAGLIAEYPRPAAPVAGHPIVRASQLEKTLDDLDLLRQLGTSDSAESAHPNAM